MLSVTTTVYDPEDSPDIVHVPLPVQLWLPAPLNCAVADPVPPVHVIVALLPVTATGVVIDGMFTETPEVVAE